MNRILIVEDEITISRLIAVSLRRAGYDCTVAKQRQVIGAVLALFPHFIAEKAVRPIGTGGKRCGALQFIMDGMRGLLGGAHMGVAFRHRGVTSF